MTEPRLAETILWSHPDAIVAIDWPKRVRYANRAARQLLATGDESIEGQDIVELLGGSESVAHAIDNACDDGEERRINVALRRGERDVEVALSLSPCIDPALPLTMLLSFRSIEERRLLDDRMGQLERLASAERLIGGFAHQLRNPLAAVSALVENLVAETPDDDPRIEYTSRLLNQVSQIDSMIRSCLDFGLDLSVVRQPSKAESIGRAAIESFAARRGVTPRWVNKEGSGSVVVCEKQVSKCLRLMLESSLEACGDVDKIELSVAPETSDTRRFVCFVVRDQGPGIDPGDLPMLFEPFYTTKARGVGIGLAAAQALALHNGGALEVHSQPGETRFTLRFRAAESPEEFHSPT